MIAFLFKETNQKTNNNNHHHIEFEIVYKHIPQFRVLKFTHIN